MRVTLAALLLALPCGAQESRTPEATVGAFQLPEGFTTKVFAAEPAVRQPISFCIDDRGRVWVVEGVTYPAWKGPAPELDRIVILEDTDGDGRHDSRKVFVEGLTFATGIEVGFGGVWVIAPPNFLFYRLNESGDKPEGPPEILLDGFGSQGGHNVVNGFTWGPDGWLYGGHGRTSISDLGPPGTPPEDRIHFDGGVWRYHPTKRIFEAFADGTTNPWGIAFDERGQMIVSNCVNAHLFHIIQGAHYEPSRERPSSRYAYKRIDAIADHFHFGSRGLGVGNDEHGGGAAHSGMLIYLGDNWPDKYRGSLFMSNINGHRINNDHPRRKGSGFTATHGQDFLVSGDKMFIGLLLQTGPDGSVFISDWYDRGECHTRDNPDRGSGRIYKISYGTPAAARPDLAKRSDDELVQLLLHRNDWYVAHARRLLQERALKGPLPGANDALRRLLRDHPDPMRRLRALWGLQAIGTLTAEDRLALLDHADEDLRAWAIQLELEGKTAGDAALAKMATMAAKDPSPVVRLHLAAGIRRLPPTRRVAVLSGLVGHAEDVDDPNLPLAVWFAAEPLAEHDLPSALNLLTSSRIPLFREFMARRIASLGSDRPIVNVATIGAKADGTTDDTEAFQKAIDRLARTGGRVLVPWSVRPYRIARPLVVANDHVEFWGPSARVQFSEGAGLTATGAELTIRGLRIEGSGAGPVLRIRQAGGVQLEELQVKGGVAIAAGRVSIATSRFDALDLELPDSGSPRVDLRELNVDRSFRLTGDRSAVRFDNCVVPSK
jgi:putative membrane-bound dehydrogenase-like protein